MRIRWRRVAREGGFLVSLLLVMSAARSSLADHYVVPSGSMQPTVAIGDHVFVNKAAYGLRLPFAKTYLLDRAEPSTGDVVVLISPEDGHTVLLKRVAAVPGDVVELHGSLQQVPPDHYLVLGDNRMNSHDGRAFGLVTRDAVRGRVIAVWWRRGPTWRPL